MRMNDRTASRWVAPVLLICVLIAGGPGRTFGQADEATIGDVPAGAGDTTAAETKAGGRTLNDDQEALRMRFTRFEETLAKMGRYLQKTEPARAELIFRALSRSKAERVGERMTLTSRLLSKEGEAPRYADAISEQEAIVAELGEILKILRSEDILDENQREQERLKELARQIAVLIDQEKIHQARTERGESAERVADAQKQTSERTGKLIDDIQSHDAQKQAEGEKQGGASEQDESGEESEAGDGEKAEKGKPGESNEGEKGEKGDKQREGNESEPSDGETPEGESPEGMPNAGDSQQGDSPMGQTSEGEKPSEGKPSGESPSGQMPSGEQPSGEQPSGQEQSQGGQSEQSGQQQSGQQSSGQQSPSQQQTPGREELEKARDRMEQAIKDLQEENRKNASREQEEAIKKLIEAKERVEEMLRQLREEEREMVLRALEARFQKMHQLQQVVLAATEELHKKGKANWQDRDYARVQDAASTELEIGFEADKALEILRADGSSVAFPEAVREIRADIDVVARRLAEEDTGELTIVIEKEVLEAIEEMIVALQKEMEELQEKKDQNSQQQQQGEPEDPGLVDKIAELKMLKTLQTRINRRTKTLGALFEGEQATEPEVISQLQELSRRQGRLHRATYDLSIGKTAE